jgi:hypothetical protein
MTDTKNKHSDKAEPPRCDFRLGKSPGYRCCLPKGHDGDHKIVIKGGDPAAGKLPPEFE